VGFGTLLCTVGSQRKREGKECFAERARAIRPAAFRGEEPGSGVSQGILFLLARQVIAVQEACQSPQPRRAAFPGFLIDVPPAVGARHCRARHGPRRRGPRRPAYNARLSTAKTNPCVRGCLPRVRHRLESLCHRWNQRAAFSHWWHSLSRLCLRASGGLAPHTLESLRPGRKPREVKAHRAQIRPGYGLTHRCRRGVEATGERGLPPTETASPQRIESVPGALAYAGAAAAREDFRSLYISNARSGFSCLWTTAATAWTIATGSSARKMLRPMSTPRAPWSTAL